MREFVKFVSFEKAAKLKRLFLLKLVMLRIRGQIIGGIST
jgi:hypothetical protein